MNLVNYIYRHRRWSADTFGLDIPSPESVTGHIRKELDEIIADPSDLMEWVDVMILAIDGAWRFAGASPQEIADKLAEKQLVNAARKWSAPEPGQPTEHIR